jgi:drug/metabolite transporter (DMT)-like permease
MSKNIPSLLTATFLALLACAIWAGNFIVARGVGTWIPPIGLAFWRWMVALLALLPFALPHLRKELPLIFPVWSAFLVMGILGVGTFNALLYIAASKTTSHQIALISCTSSVWILLLAGLLRHEKLTKLTITGTLVALIGAVIIVTHGHLGTIFSLTFNHGDRLALIAAWLWAVYCILLRYKPAAMHASVFMFSLTVIGLVTLTPFYIYESRHIAVTPFTPGAIGIFLYVGLGASVCAWFAWNSAVSTLGAVKASLIYYCIPVFTAALAITILHEPLALYHLAGFVLVFIGVVISNLRKLQR